MDIGICATGVDAEKTGPGSGSAAGRQALVEGLLPRREEIYYIIRDHHIVSFDFVRRRFIGIPERTIHYDIAMLVKAGLVRKKGKTRGVVYVVAV